MQELNSNRAAAKWWREQKKGTGVRFRGAAGPVPVLLRNSPKRVPAKQDVIKLLREGKPALLANYVIASVPSMKERVPLRPERAALL